MAVGDNEPLNWIFRQSGDQAHRAPMRLDRITPGNDGKSRRAAETANNGLRLGDWLAVEAVLSEPVSYVIFPVIREFIGKIAQKSQILTAGAKI
jgi:hypothetical protein